MPRAEPQVDGQTPVHVPVLMQTEGLSSTGERWWYGETQGASGTAGGCTVDCRMRKEEAGGKDQRDRTPSRLKPGVVLMVLHLSCLGY